MAPVRGRVGGLDERMRDVTEFLQRLGDHVGPWLYVITGGLAFGEAAILLGMVLPGETALLVAGYFCHEGVLSLPVAIVVGVLAAVLGDSVGYAFGQRFGPPLRGSRLGRWIGPRRWGLADDFLNRHGGKAVFLGRCTALLRALVPSMSGMAKMPYYRTFLPWNVAGGLFWGAGCVLLGYGFAASLHTVEKYLTWGPLPVLAVVIAGFVVIEVRSRRRHRAAADDAVDDAPEPTRAGGEG
jgi:membrane protein DedA with SNARE-associated domain